MDTSVAYKRNNNILFRKMLEYLLPTMLTTAALYLNEFLDSMIVSNLLGSGAMAIVGLGSPVMLCMAAVYTLLGSGGATLYALCIGKRDTDTAGKAIRVSVLVALGVGILFIVAGFALLDPLANLLCKDAGMMPEFKPYLRALLLSSPFIITILTLIEFLPPSGAPKVATAINLIANVTNMIMDYVYIRIFRTGVEGAAYATLTGYILGLLVIIYVFMRRKVNIPSARIRPGDLRIMGKISGFGSPAAVSQLGFALKFAFCNSQAVLYGGATAVVAFSLCNQTLSIVSIFLASVMGAAIPLIAVLHGQRDFSGESSLLRIVLLMAGGISLLCFIAFLLFTEPLAAAYNIVDPAELSLALHAVHIFAIMFIFRSFCICFMRYLQVVGRKGFSMFISVFDGFGGLIPIVFVMCRLMGLEGLWWAFPVTSFILLVVMLAWNRRIAVRSQGKYSGWLLAARDDEAEGVFDVTLPDSQQGISDVSAALMKFCADSGIEGRSAHLAALTVEEMAIYTRNRLKRGDYMDVLARLYADRIEIDFRALGVSIDPLASAPEDIEENVQLLRGIAGKLEYDYIMGMNSTRITIGRKGAVAS